MAYEWTLFICLFLALWSAIIGGVFSAFSEFIMSGLMRAAPSGGIESMQHINRTVIKTPFVTGLIFIAPVSILFALFSLTAFEGVAQLTLCLIPFIYVPSVFLMTILGNVPMNNRLERLDHASFEAQVYWRQYSRVWTRLNHFRALGCFLTSALYLFAAVTLIASGQV